VVGWGMNEMVADGLNEAGVSFGGLWYEPGLKYQEVGPGEESRALAATMSGAWILGNFSTIDELKKAVTEIKIFGYVLPALHMALLQTDDYSACRIISFQTGYYRHHGFSRLVGVIEIKFAVPFPDLQVRPLVG
jgi:hypothetical protein